MRTDVDPRKRRRGSALLLFVLMLPTVLIPLVGLAIDATKLYIVQAKLSAAVDGAALGAGRLLGTEANTEEIAGEFVTANFPTGYWGSYNLVKSIHYERTFSSHVITIYAVTDVRLWFMRLLGYDHSTVNAKAVATRRDSRIELVLDRSYSMRNNIGSLKTAAAQFVNMFLPGTDELGLIVFGGSAFVAYPTTVHLSTTGPDGHFMDTPATGQDNALTMISALQVGSDTSMAEGLWLAYQEIRTADAIDNDPLKLNAIVLFTDGVPNGFTAYFNKRTDTSLSTTSGCTYRLASATDPTTNMYGFMCSRGSGTGLAYFNPGSATGFGTFKMLLFDTSHTAKYWIMTTSNNGGSTYVNEEIQISGTPYTNCSHLSQTDMTGLSKIPPMDYYGNSTSGAADTYSALYGLYHQPYNPNLPTNGYHVGLASWNAVDNAARTILADSTLNIAIFCIGYTSNGGVDAGLMKRIANTSDSTGRNAAWQPGLYVEAADAAGMQAAFNTVASEILRLAQ